MPLQVKSEQDQRWPSGKLWISLSVENQCHVALYDHIQNVKECSELHRGSPESLWTLMITREDVWF